MVLSGFDDDRGDKDPVTNYAFPDPTSFHSGNSLGQFSMSLPPSVYDGPGVEYQGCYTDSEDRRFPETVEGTNNMYNESRTSMTVGMCAQLCQDKGMPIMGLQAGRECFCGVDVPPEADRNSDDSSCSSTCSGDATMICGGGWRNSVYHITSAESVAVLPCDFSAPPTLLYDSGNSNLISQAEQALGHTAQLEYQGCYDARYNYDDERTDAGDADMTVRECAKRCARTQNSADHFTVLAAKQYFSVSRSDCFCGDAPIDHAPVGDDTECSSRCPGDYGHICGGRYGSRVSVYKLRENGRALPANTDWRTLTRAANAIPADPCEGQGPPPGVTIGHRCVLPFSRFRSSSLTIFYLF